VETSVDFSWSLNFKRLSELKVRTTSGKLDTAVQEIASLVFPTTVPRHVTQEDILNVRLLDSKHFTAGSLHEFADNWRLLDEATFGRHRVMIDNILYKLSLSDTLVYTLKGNPSMPNANSVIGQEQFIKDQLLSWLKSGAIMKVTVDEYFIKNGITVAGIDTEKLRLCLHSLFANKATRANLKMELPFIDMLAALASDNAWMTKLDCKSGFLQLALRDEFKRYFGFIYDGQAYQFQVMPWGLASATFYYQKLQEALVDYLAIKGIVCINYIDDLAIIASSQEECKAHLLFALQLFSSLGYYLSMSKILWVPAQRMEFLGICLDTTTMVLSFSDEKKAKLKTICRRLLEPHVKVNMVQKLLGYLEHLKIAMNFHGPVAHALIQVVIDQKPKVWRMKSDFQDIILSDMAKAEVVFWLNIDLSHRERSFKYRVFDMAPNLLQVNNDYTEGYLSGKQSAFAAWECVNSCTPWHMVLGALAIRARCLHLGDLTDKKWSESQFLLIHVRCLTTDLIDVTSNTVKCHHLGALKLVIRKYEIEHNVSFKFIKDISIRTQKTERVVLPALRERIEMFTPYNILFDLCATEHTSLVFKGERVGFGTGWGTHPTTDLTNLKNIPVNSYLFPDIAQQDTLVSFLLTKNCGRLHLLVSDRGLRPTWWPLVVQKAELAEVIVLRGDSKLFGNCIGPLKCAYKYRAPARYWLFICSWFTSDFDNDSMTEFKSSLHTL
jgi:hypothetical protein